MKLRKKKKEKKKHHRLLNEHEKAPKKPEIPIIKEELP